MRGLTRAVVGQQGNRSLLRIKFNYWSWCDAVLGVHEVTTNVTVGCAINKPVVVPIALNNLLHDAIGMNECSADHG